MQSLSSSPLRVVVMAGVALGMVVPGWAEEAGETAVTVEMVGGDAITGRLEAIDAASVRVAGEAGPRVFDLAAVRRVERTQGVADTGPVGDVRVIGTDGARLCGTDVTWDGDTVRLETPDGVVVLPVARVQMIDWSRSDRESDSDDVPSWVQSLPEELDSDVVVVAKGEETQCVSCAIVGITADVVRVLLDGETIPVKRDRVVGVRWLREPTAPGDIAVEVAGGSLPASRVVWSPDGMVVDEATRLPADCLRSIDYAAGRTTRLAGLATERLDVEPFFGSLADIEELAAAFRPRVIAADDGSRHKDLVIQPRTVAVWRVPPGSRAFTTGISRGAAVGGALVVIAIDDREVFRKTIDEASAPGDQAISVGEIPLDAARRLSITVDYGRAGPVGGVVVFHDPMFTK